MRRVLTILVCSLAAASWVTADQRATMLTVDSIMRGPKLVGTAPTSVRWARDSSKIYFNWQKPEDTRSATYSVNRDGSGLRQLSADEARTLDVLPPGGRFDRARRRIVTAENGDIVIIDVTTGTRRQ